MYPAVDVAELAVGDMGVDLGGGDIAVAQEFLDGAQVNPLVEEVSGE